MLDRIREALTSVDWSLFSEHLSNDQLVAYFTHPYGMAAIGVMLLISLFCKWRIVFVALSASLAISFLARYSLAGHGVGPSRHLFLFAGGAVVIGAFIIYFLFIREE